MKRKCPIYKQKHKKKLLNNPTSCLKTKTINIWIPPGKWGSFEGPTFSSLNCIGSEKPRKVTIWANHKILWGIRETERKQTEPLPGRYLKENRGKEMGFLFLLSLPHPFCKPFLLPCMLSANIPSFYPTSDVFIISPVSQRELSTDSFWLTAGVKWALSPQHL